MRCPRFRLHHQDSKRARISKDRLRLVTAFEVTARLAWPADMVVSPRDVAVYSTYQSYLLSTRYVSECLARLKFRNLTALSSLPFSSLKIALLVRIRLVCFAFAARLSAFLWNGVVGVGCREMDRALTTRGDSGSLDDVVDAHARFVRRLEQFKLWDSSSSIGARFTGKVCDTRFLCDEQTVVVKRRKKT